MFKRSRIGNHLMAYLYLTIAIIAEVIATSALKASEEFTRLIPSVLVVVGYGTAFYCLALVLRSIPLGITYAIWSGVGVALITVVGAVMFRQMLDAPALVGIGFIVAGVVIINLFSNTTKLGGA